MITLNKTERFAGTYAMGNERWKRPVTDEAKPDTFTKSTSVQFGDSSYILDSPVDRIILTTDFTSNPADTEMEIRIGDIINLHKKGLLAPWVQDVPWLKKAKQPAQPSDMLNVIRSSGSTPGNVALQSLFNSNIAARPVAPSLQKRDVIVSVVDPEVGIKVDPQGHQTHDRSILYPVDKNGQPNGPIIIGPDSGNFGLYAKYLDAHRQPYKLFTIDIQKTADLMKTIGFGEIAETFHGREIFAPIAAFIALGYDPESFKDIQRPEGNHAEESGLSESLLNMTQVGTEPSEFTVVVDPTYANLKTSLLLTPKQAEAMKGQRFEIAGRQTLIFPFEAKFSDVPRGKPVAYLGSSFGPDGKSRFVELAINMGNASKVLLPELRDGTYHNQAWPLEIRRMLQPSRTLAHA